MPTVSATSTWILRDRASPCARNCPCFAASIEDPLPHRSCGYGELRPLSMVLISRTVLYSSPISRLVKLKENVWTSLRYGVPTAAIHCRAIWRGCGCSGQLSLSQLPLGHAFWCPCFLPTLQFKQRLDAAGRTLFETTPCKDRLRSSKVGSLATAFSVAQATTLNGFCSFLSSAGLGPV